jgi:hypothetical protein
LAKFGSRRSKIEERISDPGDEGSPVGRFAIGCTIVAIVAVLVLGAIGIAIGANERIAAFGGDESEEEEEGEEVVPPPSGPEAVGTASNVGTGPQPVQPSDPARLSTTEEMRRRYRPGPFATIDSMVPSGRLLPATIPGQVISGRTVDNPWIVPGGELSPAMLPNAAGGPRLGHAVGEAANEPLTVIARTPSRVRVRAEDGSTNIVAYLVEFVGYQGHFRLPSTAPTELGAVSAGSDGATVHFAIAYPIHPDRSPIAPGETFPVTMRVAAVDDQGRISSPVIRQLNVMALGAGDVEVTLTMSHATDLDLYVTDPTGVTIYYGNTNAGTSGGRLDLDANAACSSNMGVNNEHVFWSQGGAPSGTYRVHVAHWRNCVGHAVTYRVTVRACGETVVLSGGFTGEGQGGMCERATPSDRGWCQEVVTFDVPPCPPS